MTDTPSESATVRPAPTADGARDSSDPSHSSSAAAEPSAAAPDRRTVVIPPETSMVAVLGPHDELLRTIERSLPTLDVHVRGNEMHFAGPPGISTSPSDSWVSSSSSSPQVSRSTATPSSARSACCATAPASALPTC